MRLAIDIGCGDKLYAPNHPKGDYRWVGVDKYDFSDLYRPGEFQQHDLSQMLPFGDGSVDLAWSHHVLEHLPPRHPTRDIDWVIFVMNEVWRVLRPQAQFHVVVPWREHNNSWRAPTHYREFAPETFNWFSCKATSMQAEHAASGLYARWVVNRTEVVDGCHVYAILTKT